MNKLKRNESGFSAVEGILVLVIIAMLGFVGWYVRHNRTTITKATNATTATSTVSTTKKVKQQKNISDDWLEYKTANYSVKFADGWTIMLKDGPEKNSFFSTNNNDLKYKAGQKAVVKDYVQSGPGEFTYGLFIDYNASSSKTGKCSDSSAYKLTLKTENGDNIYTEISEGTDANAEETNLLKGDKFYGYCVQLGSSTVVFGYTLQTGSADHSATLEQVVKTVKSI